MIDEGLTVGSNNGTGVLTIQDGGIVTSGSGAILMSSTATVDGPGSAWIITGNLAMFHDIDSTLNIRNGGRVTLGLNGFSSMLANSTATISLDSAGIFDVRTTIALVNSTFDFLGGTLHVGEFDGNLVNQGGVLAPGNPDEPVGSTNITGSYTHQSAATLEIEIGGTASGTQHDFANVEGTALVAGTLQLTLIDGFVPAADDEFVVFNVDTLLLGAFGNVVDGQRLATSDGSGSFVVRYGPTSTFNANQIVLTDFLPMFSADFDLDGDVDGDDLDGWQLAYGVSDSADADGDGNSNGRDFLIWQRQFGSGVGAAEAVVVPEPAIAILLISALLTVYTRRSEPSVTSSRLAS